MICPKPNYREAQYRPQAAKTLRHILIQFITREFPRLGGPWVVELFVDKLLDLFNLYHPAQERLAPGQTIWLAVAADEQPGHKKPMTHTRQVPVVITLISPDNIEDLRARQPRRELFKQIMVRAANDAFAQGGVLSVTDLSLLFCLSPTHAAELIREYEQQTNTVVPRRGSLHDLGKTVTHKRIICRKAYLEGKPTHIIAKETYHSPIAVDRYILDLARVFFAIYQQGMSKPDASFATQLPLYLVEEYVALIQELGLDQQQVYNRAKLKLTGQTDTAQPEGAADECAGQENPPQNERREQPPTGVSAAPAFALG
jgi:hypothetical protein